MSAGPWLWLGLGMAAFAVGFLLSWLQMRKHLQRRVNEVVVDEVARRIEARVLDELRGQAPGSEPPRKANRASGDYEHE